MKCQTAVTPGVLWEMMEDVRGTILADHVGTTVVSIPSLPAEHQERYPYPFSNNPKIAHITPDDGFSVVA